jgi:hypothetical protein
MSGAGVEEGEDRPVAGLLDEADEEPVHPVGLDSRVGVDPD